MSSATYKVSFSLALLFLLVLLITDYRECEIHAQSAKLHNPEYIAVIDTCLAAFKKFYIYPAMVSDMEVYIKQKIRDSVYHEITTLADLTRQLRHDMREVTNDRHIWIGIMADIRPTRGPLTGEQLKQKRMDNYGFVKLEILPENIGYLQLNRFDDPEFAGETAVAAMQFLAHTDQIIIDLRENHGGDGKMVRLISSYFLEGETKLNSLYFRASDSMVQAHTYAHVPGKRLVRQGLYILTSKQTASAAESFAYTMQNYRRALIVGENTRGAAHWTETYPFPELGIFLEIPVARPINPVTKRGWEGSGVEPDIKVAAAQALDKAKGLALDQKNISEQD